jgi:hypothetical protein
MRVDSVQIEHACFFKWAVFQFAQRRRSELQEERPTRTDHRSRACFANIIGQAVLRNDRRDEQPHNSKQN